MARIRNLSVYSTDRDYLQRLADELTWLGRGRWLQLDLKGGRLTQLVYPPHKPKRKRGDDKDEKTPRNKHAESAARHS